MISLKPASALYLFRKGFAGSGPMDTYEIAKNLRVNEGVVANALAAADKHDVKRRNASFLDAVRLERQSP
jgi:hypothetical protein